MTKSTFSLRLNWQLIKCLSPITRILPRGGWAIAKALKVDQMSDLDWSGVKKVWVKERMSGLYYEVDHGRWRDRHLYVLGHFYNEFLFQAMMSSLDEHTCFIDIGMNRGNISTQAAQRMGPNGQVIGIEPNPQMIEYAEKVIQRNRLNNIKILQGVFGSDNEVNELWFSNTGHDGMVNLRGDGDYSIQVSNITSELLRQEIKDELRLVIKIDVEGWEFHVLKHLGQILDQATDVFIEITDVWLKESGQSAQELYEYMYARDFKSIRIDNDNQQLTEHTDALDIKQYDVHFTKRFIQI